MSTMIKNLIIIIFLNRPIKILVEYILPERIICQEMPQKNLSI